MKIEPNQHYALITVFYKNHPDFNRLVQAIHNSGRLIISSGGTAKHIESLGIPVIEVSKLTGAPEMMGGRVKILHPTVFGGILGRVGVVEDTEAMKEHNIPNIDIVVCNPYPFAEEVSKGDETTDENIIEKIDVGGPSAIAAAGKNHKRVSVIFDPADYGPFTAMIESGDEIPLSQRRKFAAKAFNISSKYYADVAEYLDKEQP